MSQEKTTTKDKDNQNNQDSQNKDNQNKEEKALIEKVITINRVTKVTKGGKNLGFSALVVVGDGNGSAGYALGKANDVASAIRKGLGRAKKSIRPVKRKDTTIPHQALGKFGAIEVLLKPASRGTGVIASAVIRAICECAGISDILTKIVRKSTNPINVVKATFSGFDDLKGE